MPGRKSSLGKKKRNSLVGNCFRMNMPWQTLFPCTPFADECAWDIAGCRLRRIEILFDDGLMKDKRRKSFMLLNEFTCRYSEPDNRYPRVVFGMTELATLWDSW